MGQNNYSQLELFSQGRGYSGQKVRGRDTFFSYMRSHERIVIIIIGFIIIGMVSFSLGVERGKRMTTLKFNSRLDLAAKIESAPATQKPLAYKQENSLKTKPSVSLEAASQNIPKYTVQIASYQKQVHAQKEAEVLRKKGFSPLILTKGKYIILCVGNFPSKEGATALFSEFKRQRRYQDCLLRRL